MYCSIASRALSDFLCNLLNHVVGYIAHFHDEKEQATAITDFLSFFAAKLGLRFEELGAAEGKTKRRGTTVRAKQICTWGCRSMRQIRHRVVERYQSSSHVACQRATFVAKQLCCANAATMRRYSFATTVSYKPMWVSPSWLSMPT